VGDTYMRKGHYVNWSLVLPFIPDLERAVIVGKVDAKENNVIITIIQFRTRCTVDSHALFHKKHDI
jgi:hypothetical protein